MKQEGTGWNQGGPKHTAEHEPKSTNTPCPSPDGFAKVNGEAAKLSTRPSLRTGVLRFDALGGGGLLPFRTVIGPPSEVGRILAGSTNNPLDSRCTKQRPLGQSVNTAARKASPRRAGRPKNFGTAPNFFGYAVHHRARPNGVKGESTLDPYPQTSRSRTHQQQRACKYHPPCYPKGASPKRQRLEPEYRTDTGQQLRGVSTSRAKPGVQ